jgi:hypothetical protein
MPFRVQDFRSQLVNDGARPNLFECTISFPTLATVGGIVGAANAQGADQKYTFMCRSAQLPGSTINPVVQNYFGREAKFAGNRTFPEWTVTVINDEDFSVRNAFEKWMSGINSHNGNLRHPQFLQGDGGYQRDGKIIQYGKIGDIVKIYNFIGMFPIDVSPIELDWGANDTIEEYAVTFSYQWWESDTTDIQTNLPIAGL